MGRRPFYMRFLGWILPNPDITGGFGLVVLALVVALMASCVASLTGHSQTLARHTAEWYAQPEHEAVRSAIVQVCRADPALARQNGDCINAQHAQLIVAERQGSRRIDLTPPNRPEYWRDRPEERRVHLRLCAKMTPLEQKMAYCDAARRSL